MAKFWSYVVIVLGIAFLMSIAGFDSGISYYLTLFGLGTTTNLTGSAFFLALGVALTAAGGVATIIIGLFGRTAPEYLFLAPLAGTFFVPMVAMFGTIINAIGASSWLYYPTLAIFGVLAVGYILSAVEWVFGRD